MYCYKRISKGNNLYHYFKKKKRYNTNNIKSDIINNKNSNITSSLCILHLICHLVCHGTYTNDV